MLLLDAICPCSQPGFDASNAIATFERPNMFKQMQSFGARSAKDLEFQED